MSTGSSGGHDCEDEETTVKLPGKNAVDSDHEDLYHHHHHRHASADTARASGRGTKSQDGRDRALQRELDKIRAVNGVVSSVIDSLETSRTSMDTVHDTVRSASTLLDTWTRILSQTEHNQRLLLNAQWKGAAQDLEEMENASVLRQQVADRRRAAEEEMRREASARAAAAAAAAEVEGEERRRAAAAPGGRGVPRGRGARGGMTARGVGLLSRAAPSTRGRGSAASSSSSSTSRQRSTVPSRAATASGIGRGIMGTRGRGRA